MDRRVPKNGEHAKGIGPTDTERLVEMLLAMSNEEVELLERLYRATAPVRSSPASHEQKTEALERVLDGDPRLGEAFRRLVGADLPAGSREAGRPPQRIARG